MTTFPFSAYFEYYQTLNLVTFTHPHVKDLPRLIIHSHLTEQTTQNDEREHPRQNDLSTLLHLER